MTNLDSILKSRGITLATKVHLVKAMVFPVVMYGCESWTIKKAEGRRIDAFELWCWRRLLRVPWTARRANQSILKEISPEYSLEGLMLKLKLQLWPCDAKNWLLGKDSDAGKDWRQEEKGTTEDEMVGWHHRLYGHEFEQVPVVMDKEAWHAAVHGVAKSRTLLSNWTELRNTDLFFFFFLGKPDFWLESATENNKCMRSQGHIRKVLHSRLNNFDFQRSLLDKVCKWQVNN